MVRCVEGLRLYRAGQRLGGRSAARDLPARRRLSDRLRGGPRALSGAEAPAGLASLPRPQYGREHRDPSVPAAAAYARAGGAGERLGAGAGQVVQSCPWIRLPHPWRRYP